MIPSVIVAFWLICGVFAYGTTLYSFTKEFPSMRHYAPSILMGALGPFGLLTACVMGKWGLRFRHLSVEERWQIFEKQFGILGRSYFDEHEA